MVDMYGLKSKLVATGSPPGTFTAVMSGQITVGWASPPFGFDAIDQKKIRIVARANDVPAIRNQSIRVLAANLQFMQAHRDALDKFMAAYRETLDWMYVGDEPIAAYAKFSGSTPANARRIRAGFMPESMLQPDKIMGIDSLMADAIRFKMISAPLTAAQVKELIQIPPRS